MSLESQREKGGKWSYKLLAVPSDTNLQTIGLVKGSPFMENLGIETSSLPENLAFPMSKELNRSTCREIYYLPII